MAKVYIGLGSNMGDKLAYLQKAIQLLSHHKDILIKKTSSFYETAPVGFTDQDQFINCVVEIETQLPPHQLLEYCQLIEQQLKRERIVRWGPRTIDVDILLYDDLTLNEEVLTLPHPRMIERAFVMIPLYEIASDLQINGVSIKSYVNKLKNEIQMNDIKKLILT